MSETTPVITTDLDRLSERVEKAAALVQNLRDDRAKLERERDEMARRLKDQEQKLQGQDVDTHLEQLRNLQRAQAPGQPHEAPIGLPNDADPAIHATTGGKSHAMKASVKPATPQDFRRRPGVRDRASRPVVSRSQHVELCVAPSDLSPVGPRRQASAG